MASNPRRIENVVINIVMPGNEYSKSEKTILEKAARGCPVCESLKPGIAKLNFEWPTPSA